MASPPSSSSSSPSSPPSPSSRHHPPPRRSAPPHRSRRRVRRGVGAGGAGGSDGRGYLSGSLSAIQRAVDGGGLEGGGGADVSPVHGTAGEGCSKPGLQRRMARRKVAPDSCFVHWHACLLRLLLSSRSSPPCLPHCPPQVVNHIQMPAPLANSTFKSSLLSFPLPLLFRAQLSAWCCSWTSLIWLVVSGAHCHCHGR